MDEKSARPLHAQNRLQASAQELRQASRGSSPGPRGCAQIRKVAPEAASPRASWARNLHGHCTLGTASRQAPRSSSRRRDARARLGRRNLLSRWAVATAPFLFTHVHGSSAAWPLTSVGIRHPQFCTETTSGNPVARVARNLRRASGEELARVAGDGLEPHGREICTVIARSEQPPGQEAPL